MAQTRQRPGTAERVARGGGARQVAVPPAARALTTLPRVDYEDAFLAETDAAQERTGEEWARAFFEDAPANVRRTLRRGWFLLGVRLGSMEDERLVFGWEIRRSDPDVALLATHTVFGIDAELLVKRQPRSVLVATFLHIKNPFARRVWSGAVHGHRRFVSYLLGRATRPAGPAGRPGVTRR